MAPVFLLFVVFVVFVDPSLGPVATLVPYQIVHPVKGDMAVVASAILMRGVPVLSEAIRSVKGAAAPIALVRKMARAAVLVQGLDTAKAAVAIVALNARRPVDARSVDVIVEPGGTAEGAIAALAPMRVMDAGIAVLRQRVLAAKVAIAVVTVKRPHPRLEARYPKALLHLAEEAPIRSFPAGPVAAADAGLISHGVCTDTRVGVVVKV